MESSDSTKIEEYLDKETFRCERYKARISKKQCLMNCGRTIYNQIVYSRRLKALERNPGRFGNDEFLFHTQLFLGKMTCSGCSRFKKPNEKTQRKINFLQMKASFNSMAETEIYEEDSISACSSL